MRVFIECSQCFMMMCGHAKMCSVHTVAAWLLWIGGINWGLVGAFNYNLLNAVLGSVPVLERVVYVLVGVSALLMCFMGKCKSCIGACEMKK